MSAGFCGCGHPERLHTADYGCDNTSCGCTAFRDDGRVAAPAPADSTEGQAPRAPLAPVPDTPAPPPPAPVTAPTAGPALDQLIAAGLRSKTARIRGLAERIQAHAEDLRQRLAEERAAAEVKRQALIEREQARAEVERLEKRLAEAKAKLRPPKAAKPDLDPAELHECPECGEKKKNLGPHRARAHGFRREAS